MFAIGLQHEQPKKKFLLSNYTGCSIGILIIASYNLHIAVSYSPLFTLNSEDHFEYEVSVVLLN